MKYGLIRIEGEGEEVSIKTHEIIKVFYNSELPDGHIIEVLQSGYFYNGQVIRRAKVILNKNNVKI